MRIYKAYQHLKSRQKTSFVHLLNFLWFRLVPYLPWTSFVHLLNFLWFRPVPYLPWPLSLNVGVYKRTYKKKGREEGKAVDFGLWLAGHRKPQEETRSGRLYWANRHTHMHTHTLLGRRSHVGKKGPRVHPPQQAESWLAPSTVPTGLS